MLLINFFSLFTALSQERGDQLDWAKHPDYKVRNIAIGSFIIQLRKILNISDPEPLPRPQVRKDKIFQAPLSLLTQGFV